MRSSSKHTSSTLDPLQTQIHPSPKTLQGRNSLNIDYIMNKTSISSVSVLGTDLCSSCGSSTFLHTFPLYHVLMGFMFTVIGSCQKTLLPYAPLWLMMNYTCSNCDADSCPDMKYKYPHLDNFRYCNEITADTVEPLFTNHQRTGAPKQHT